MTCDCGLCGPEIAGLLEATAASKARVGLAHHPEWSDRRIAEHVGVSDFTVRQLRGNLAVDPEEPPQKREGRDGRQRGPRTPPEDKLTPRQRRYRERAYRDNVMANFAMTCIQIANLTYEGEVDSDLYDLACSARDNLVKLADNIEERLDA